MVDAMRKKAEASMVEMDTVLAEAFFAFYWLSNGREATIGMSGAIEFMIPLSEVVSYHQIFEPKMDLQHFVRVIRSADRKYLQLAAEKQAKKSQETK